MDTAVANGGVDVRGDSRANHVHHLGHSGNGEFNLSVRVDPALLEHQRLERLAGSFVLSYASGGTQAVADPAGKWVGRDLAIPDREDIEIRIVSIGPGETVIRYANATNQMIANITFEDAHGNDIALGGHNTHGDGYYYTRTYTNAVPEDGRIIFALHGETAKVQVPFEVTDIPLTEAE